MRTEQQSPQELRERILEATLVVIRERGMARTRTSAIARAAGCAEGSIYRYFSGKPELLYELLRTRLPGLIDVLLALRSRAGTATLQANLLEVARASSSFYGEFAPLLAGLLADTELLAEQRGLLARAARGPDGASEALAAYLRAEQEFGRVRTSADVDLAARLLLSSCLGQALVDTLLGGDVDDLQRERYARALVEMVVRDLEPDGGGAR